MSMKAVTPIPTSKYLDYTGLGYYDGKIKTWVKGLGIPIGTREVNGVIHVDKSIVFETPVSMKGESTAENLTVSGDVKLLDATVGYSDIRLKTDVRELETVMSKVCKLNVCRYRPNEIAQSAGVYDKEEIGLIAGEVADIFPELVKTSPITDILNSVEEYKTIDYARMSAVLVKVIQEMNLEYEKKFKSLEDRLLRLESK